MSTDHSPPSHLAETDDLSPSYSVSTDYTPSESSTDYSPESPLSAVLGVDGLLSSIALGVGPGDNPSSSYSESVLAGHSPPSHWGSTDTFSPSYSVSTNDHSPSSAEPQHPVAPESDFFGKLMKGRFRRRISGYGPRNVVQKELQGTIGPGTYVSTLSSLFCQRLRVTKHSDLPLLNCLGS